MKTITTLLIIISAFFCNQIIAQNKVLKVNFGEEPNKWIMFPPNTVFSLVDSNLTTVFSNKSDFGIFVIEEKCRLEIFPKYKETSDVYILENGSIEIIEKDFFIDKKTIHKTAKKSKNLKIHSERIAAKKTITDSENLKNRKNLVLKFTNGIVFTYTDGKTSAKLNGKDLYIEGNFLIYSTLGVAKISFNPKNGETWWVFDADKN